MLWCSKNAPAIQTSWYEAWRFGLYGNVMAITIITIINLDREVP
jgi:hypothetical protein